MASQPLQICALFIRSCKVKKTIFLVCLFLLLFWDCGSKKLLRLFSGNLPAMYFSSRTLENFITYDGLLLIIIIENLETFSGCELEHKIKYSEKSVIVIVCIWSEAIYFAVSRFLLQSEVN